MLLPIHGVLKSRLAVRHCAALDHHQLVSPRHRDPCYWNRAAFGWHSPCPSPRVDGASVRRAIEAMGEEGRGMDRVRVVVAAVVAAMAVALTAILVADGTPGARMARAELEWMRHMGEAEAALAAGDGPAALASLRAAHQAAVRMERWEALAAVGDAARRSGEMAAPARHAVSTASRAYLAGLAVARERRSVEGVLRVAEGFAALGDREMVEYCVGVAGRLAQHDGAAERQSHVRGFVEAYRETRGPAREGPRE
jgi:hypothetical protein